MKNIQQQEQVFSISKEEPILGYLFKKLLRQDPQMKGKNLDQELNKIEEYSANIINNNNPEFTERFENIANYFSEEELKEIFINFFEELTDQPLSEQEKLIKINDFFENFGFEVVQDRNGATTICI